MMPGSRGTKIRKDEGYEKGQPFVMYRDSSLYDVVFCQQKKSLTQHR